VVAERRTDERIRDEIATERAELVAALADLQAGVDAKRRAAAAVAGSLALAAAALTAVKVGRRFRRG
jgi:hypothetical protein